MNLIYLILLSIGCVSIFQTEYVFSFIRTFIEKKSTRIYNFIMCPSCFGFWIGFIIGFFIPVLSPLFFNLFFCGVVSSLMNKLYFLFVPQPFI